LTDRRAPTKVNLCIPNRESYTRIPLFNARDPIAPSEASKLVEVVEVLEAPSKAFIVTIIGLRKALPNVVDAP